MKIRVKTASGKYFVHIGKGLLESADKLFTVRGKVLVVTDDGVPNRYADAVADCFPGSVKLVLPRGEENKNLSVYELILTALTENEFCRKDAVIAVGGGVVGDMAGFAAATYMRGIGFYNVPTTLLSQTDSSVGGKTGVDFCSIKNSVGAFYQPSGVIIDTSCLETLDDRQIRCGLAEIIKMGVISDKKLFEIIEAGRQNELIDEVIFRSINAKRKIVEKDEKESGERRLLNLGHTLGHAVEAKSEGKYLHGECVAMALPLMCGDKIKQRVKNTLMSVGLPVEIPYTAEELMPYIIHDKKSVGEKTAVVTAEDIGVCRIEYKTAKELLNEKLYRR